MKPRCLDLFCGAGGSAKGWQRAGFHVTGVDVKPQPHYCGERFCQADALEFVAEHGHKYDLLSASPPCQAYSRCQGLPSCRGKAYPDLIAATRAALEATGKPWIIENVGGAPLRNPVMLCGTQFGLKVYRHRFFESNLLLLVPPHFPHRDRLLKNRGPSPKGFVIVAGQQFTLPQGQAAMRIDWMTKKELSQAIPPAFTEFFGRQMLAARRR